MAILPTTSSNLELTISAPGLSSYPGSLPPSVRDLDINQVPLGEEESFEDEEESSNGGPPRKKLRLTKEQSRLLEESFRQNHTLNPKQKEALAAQLKLRPRQVEVWFQNRRARSKLKQTEMECEYLKRWFGSLTEQNRRLHKEVEELRAMKVGPPTVNGRDPLPASTLSMCPRCERVTNSSDKCNNSSSRITTATTTITTATTATTTSDHSVLSPKVSSALQLRQPSSAC
ncbi:homeobox-leucine zipper protein ATHB-17-like [Rutidosis leptorrhynchoides]|uniref:homeobox-leucine zipper protein ATHB-17-like n=1 Tax=Rutidosis leptorrhynchoides TaxID=125765 RepID=UPI003A9A2182